MHLFWVQKNSAVYKGTFLSESTDVFVITSNRRTFYFPETENLNFGDWSQILAEDVSFHMKH